MVIRCKGFSDERIETDLSGFIRLLKGSGILNIKGEPCEMLEVFLGGPFFSADGNEKADKGEIKSFPWTFSTFDLDRDEERIDPNGWELENYLKNPVVLWSHDRMVPAIGFSENVRVKDRRLEGNTVFNDKELDPFGWGIGMRVASGVLRAGSVGFLVKKIEFVEEDGRENLVFRNQELLEFSICNVPSNPFALVQEAKIQKEEEFANINKLSSFCDDESEEGIKEFWKGLIKRMDGGVY